MSSNDDRFTRREVLRIGALSVFGSAAIPALSSAAQRSSANQNACILLFLQGGPSHLDLWDPKPHAPSEVRGPFGSIATRVGGLRFCETLPKTAAAADKLAVIRSMTHGFNNHIAGTYIMHTGSATQPNADREAAADDYPGPGAVLNWMQKKATNVPVSVALPNWLSIPGPSNRMPGQYGGFLGSQYDPFLIQGDPSKPGFKPLSLTLPGDVSASRLRARGSLLAQLDRGVRQLETSATHSHDRYFETAMTFLTDHRLRDALDLRREKPAMRDMYGRNRFGQSLLLARRLVEAGVRFVAFNEFNQSWDHHSAVEKNLKTCVPSMDRGHSALLADLEQRGMLQRTLVIATGEFGRAPKMNADGGRDHWPQAYSTLLAGGGIRGGQTYGRSDSRGAYVADKPVRPVDLLATMWTVLGIDPATELHDRTNRPHPLSRGQVLTTLF
jgi:Protein of unknown function (DUF1501)